MAIAAALLSPSVAHAAGTTAGTTITNNVTVSYKVANIDQSDETATNDITVDRKIDLNLVRTDNTATNVTPGSTSQAVTFELENLSNDTLDFALGSVQVVTGAPSGFSGSDTFDTTGGFTYYLDDGDGIFNGADALVTHIDALAPDSPIVIHVVAATVPGGLSDGDIAGLTLTATARQNDAAATLGSAFTEATANTAGVDTIFADGAGDTDGSRDAAFSATDDFVVLTATLSAAKSSAIVAGDFGTGAAIPGATIEYCIAVTNSGSADATTVNISDTLPSEVTYDTAFGVKLGGADCSTPGTGSGSESGGVVSGTIATLAPSSTQTLIFRATID